MGLVGERVGGGGKGGLPVAHNPTTPAVLQKQLSERSRRVKPPPPSPPPPPLPPPLNVVAVASQRPHSIDPLPPPPTPILKAGGGRDGGGEGKGREKRFSDYDQSSPFVYPTSLPSTIQGLIYNASRFQRV